MSVDAVVIKRDVHMYEVWAGCLDEWGQVHCQERHLLHSEFRDGARAERYAELLNKEEE